MRSWGTRPGTLDCPGFHWGPFRSTILAVPMSTADPRSQRPIRTVSVLMPTYNAMEFLERVLHALESQDCELPWDFSVIDSGSTDGTLECIEAWKPEAPVPVRFRSIEQEEFDHGDTRNALAAECQADLLVFLTQDAIPSNGQWLRLLVRNFEDPTVGAAYCRNIPRDDAQTLTKVFCRNDPGYRTERVEERMPDPETLARMSDEEVRTLCNFNDVSSAIRRELWERHPFPRTTMGEDVLMGRGILEAGFTVVYDADATVDHSHDYGPEKMRWRGWVDSKFNAEWLNRIAIQSESMIEPARDLMVAGDMEHLETMGFSPGELEALRGEALALREASARGLYEGGLSPLRYPRSVMRDDGEVHVLQVVRRFPPESSGGDVGARTFELSQALGRRGHRVTVLALSPSADDGQLRLWREAVGEISTLRVREPAEAGVLDAAFQSILACENPDIIHFEGVGPSSIGLIRTAYAACIPSIVSLFDDEILRSARVESLEAIGLAELRIIHDKDLRKRFLEAGDYDPQHFAYCPASQFEAAGEEKSFEDEAIELEYRYRAFSCVVRESQGDRPLVNLSGADAKTEGEATRQGANWLLLHPGSAATYTLPEDLSGPVVIEVEQYSLASEPGIVLGGRVLVDGERVGSIPPVRASQEDTSVQSGFACEIPEGSRELRLEPVLEGSGYGLFLRLCRVTMTRPRRSDADQFESQTPPPADPLELAEELRVDPGPRIDRQDLPRATVIIPSLNGRRILRGCLDSLLASDYEHDRLEILVVDNGSTDGTADWLARRYPGVRVVPQGRNLGFAAACNAGARAVESSEVLVFVNNDMVLEDGFLFELVAPLVRRECAATTAKLLNTDGTAIDTSGTGSTFLGIAVQPGYGAPSSPQHEIQRKTLFPCGGAMAIERSAFDQIGGFDEAYFAYYEDLDLGWRLWLAGHEVHYVPTAVGYHHHSHTSNRFPPEVVRLVMIRNSLYTCVKNYNDDNLARVLPVMLALAIRRAYLGAGLNESLFRIEDAKLGKGGLLGWIRGLGDPTRRTAPIGRIGAADLVAINDLLGNWDTWMEKRLEVQSQRRRSDAEIQRMFIEPLTCVEGEPSYVALQSGLVSLFGLDDTFQRR